MGRHVFERKKQKPSKTKVLCKTKPALALRQRVLKLIMILQCICSNVSKKSSDYLPATIPRPHPPASPLRRTVFTQRLVSGHAYDGNIAS